MRDRGQDSMPNSPSENVAQLVELLNQPKEIFDASQFKQLAQDTDINTDFYYGQPILCYAVLKNHIRGIEILLKAVATLDITDQDGNTPWHLAAKEGHTDLIQLFTSSRADAEVQGINTAWKVVIQVLYYALVELFIKPFPKFMLNPQEAVNHNELMKSEVLSNKYTDNINVKNKNEDTPLHLAIKNGYTAAAILLIKYGARIDNIDKDGDTALHLTVEKGGTDLVKLFTTNLMKLSSIPTDTQDQNLNAIFQLITQGTEAELIKLFTQFMADPQDKNTGEQLVKHKGYLELLLRFAQYSADANIKNKNGDSALHLAIKKGNIEVATLLVENISSIESIDQNGDSALHLAIKNGHILLATLLVKKSSFNCIKSINNNGDSVLNLAAKAGNIDLVKLLMGSFVDPYAQDQDGNNILQLLTHRRDAELLKLLTTYVTASNINLKKTFFDLAAKGDIAEMRTLLMHWQVDMSAEDFTSGDTPLHLTIQEGHTEIATLLIDTMSSKDFSLDVKVRTGSCSNAPLHLAIKKGNFAVAALLVQKGARLDIMDINNDIPLHIAAAGGHTGIVELLTNSANIIAQFKATNSAGHTPLHLAAKNGHIGVATLLVQKGAIVDIRGRNNNDTPLHLAAKKGHIPMVTLLIELGADSSEQDQDGNNIFHLAAAGGHTGLVELLISTGSNISNKNNSGKEPLHLAAKEGHADMVELLISNGANPNAPDANNDNPIHLAVDMGHKEVIALLLPYLDKVDEDTIKLQSYASQLVALALGKVDIKVFNDPEKDSTDSESDSGDSEDESSTLGNLVEYAAKRGLTTLLKSLLEKVPNPKELIDSTDAVIYAAMLGEVKIVKLFIEYNANFEKTIQRKGKDIYSIPWSMLMSNVNEWKLKSEWDDAYNEFEQDYYGEQTNDSGRWFDRVNWEQVKVGRLQILNLFINNKSIKVNDIGAYSWRGADEIIWEYSLLELAIIGDYVELAHNLLKSGAKINIKLNWKEEVVFETESLKKVRMPQNVEMVKLLVAYNIPIQESNSETPLQINQTFIKSNMIRDSLKLQFSNVVDSNQDKDIGELFYKIICGSINQVDVSDDQLTTNSLNILNAVIKQQLIQQWILSITKLSSETIPIPPEYTKDIADGLIKKIQAEGIPYPYKSSSEFIKDKSKAYPFLEGLEGPLQTFQEQAYQDMMQLVSNLHYLGNDKINISNNYIANALELMNELTPNPKSHTNSTLSKEKEEEIKSLSIAAKNDPVILLKAILDACTSYSSNIATESLEDIMKIKTIQEIMAQLFDKRLQCIGTYEQIKGLEEFNKELSTKLCQYNEEHYSWFQYEMQYQQDYLSEYLGVTQESINVLED